MDNFRIDWIFRGLTDSLIFIIIKVKLYLVYFSNIFRSQNSHAQLINKKYLEVVFKVEENTYIYYAEVDRKTLLADITVKNPDNIEYKFYPGLIPKIKAKTIGLEFFIVSVDGEDKKLSSLEKILP